MPAEPDTPRNVSAERIPLTIQPAPQRSFAYTQSATSLIPVAFEGEQGGADLIHFEPLGL